MVGNLSGRDRIISVLQHRPNSLYQAAGRNGLVKQFTNAQAGGAFPDAAIQPTGYQYSRNLYAPLSQVVDDVETAGAGHVLVDEQTARRAMPFISQELVSRTVGLHIEPEGFEQCLQRVGNRLVVINYADRVLNFARGRVLSKSGHADLIGEYALRAGCRGAEH